MATAKHWMDETASEWLYRAYQRERRRLLSNCHAHRKGMGLGRHSRKVCQLDLIRLRAGWAMTRQHMIGAQPLTRTERFTGQFADSFVA